MKKNIYKKCLKVLMKDGTIQSLGPRNKILKEDVSGFILKSGKIVSLNVYGPTKFSMKKLTRYPKHLIVEDIGAIKLDNHGQTNTKSLIEYCSCSTLSVLTCIEKNEYIPSIGELMEIFDREDGVIKELNLTRKLIGLEPIPIFSWYWSSTIKSKESVWVIRGDGGINWDFWSSDWISRRVIYFCYSPLSREA